jgi:hypothetical protein
LWVAQHDRKLGTTLCNTNVKVKWEILLPNAFNILKIRIEHKISNYPRFSIAPKKRMKINVFFKRFFWDHSLYIHFNSFLDICFFSFFFPHAFYSTPNFHNNKAQHLDLSRLKLVILKIAQNFKKSNFQWWQFCIQFVL